MIKCVILLLVIAAASAECPSGEYDPGPDCSFEVICPIPAHSARRHYCDCWCSPPAIRDSVTNACVEECPDYKPW